MTTRLQPLRNEKVTRREEKPLQPAKLSPLEPLLKVEWPCKKQHM
jgi:hypothetical protein